jgi:hypothetical protein
MYNTMKALFLSAAVSGILSGTAVRAQAQTNDSSGNQVTSTNAGLRSIGFADKDKHSCKGKNGCKSGDNGCKGKNSCKGKGGCATDGSPMPKAA